MKSLKMLTSPSFLLMIPFLTSAAPSSQGMKLDDENVRTIKLEGSDQNEI